jgi:hypothetical protein
MLAWVTTAAVLGLEGRLVEVQVDIAHQGLPNFFLVRLNATILCVIFGREWRGRPQFVEGKPAATGVGRGLDEVAPTRALDLFYLEPRGPVGRRARRTADLRRSDRITRPGSSAGRWRLANPRLPPLAGSSARRAALHHASGAGGGAPVPVRPRCGAWGHAARGCVGHRKSARAVPRRSLSMTTDWPAATHCV